MSRKAGDQRGDAVMNREQFTFYRSFWDALRVLPKKEQLSFALALCAYALDGEELPLSGAAAASFVLAKPVLDTARRKAESGKQGGSKPKAAGKQTQANRKQTVREKEGEKEKEKEREKEKEGEIENECYYIPPASSDDEDDPPAGDAPLPGSRVVVAVVVRAVGKIFLFPWRKCPAVLVHWGKARRSKKLIVFSLLFGRN